MGVDNGAHDDLSASEIRIELLFSFGLGKTEQDKSYDKSHTNAFLVLGCQRKNFPQLLKYVAEV